MNLFKQAPFSHVFQSVLILSFGLVMIPFVDMPATTIGWELFAGAASFFINTTGADPGSYSVMMAVDINISATRMIDLTSIDPIVTAPPGATGSTFFISRVLFLPFIENQ